MGAKRLWRKRVGHILSRVTILLGWLICFVGIPPLPRPNCPRLSLAAQALNRHKHNNTLATFIITSDVIRQAHQSPATFFLPPVELTAWHPSFVSLHFQYVARMKPKRNTGN